LTIPFDRSQSKLIVVHHLGDGQPPCKTVDELIRRSTPIGYGAPVYDFGVLENGECVELRSLMLQGAHCIPNVARYEHEDRQWWNKKSIGIVVASDNEKYSVNENMYAGLINKLVYLCNMQGISADNIYPHFQVYSTKCPGASYRKLCLNTGHLDYDRVEQSVNSRCLLKANL